MGLEDKIIVNVQIIGLLSLHKNIDFEVNRSFEEGSAKFLL